MSEKIMTPAEIPQELIDILNERAGKVHRQDDPVIKCLAEILTKYDQLKSDDCYWCGQTHTFEEQDNGEKWTLF